MTADLARASALTVRCPRCHVRPGQPCVDLLGLEKRWPHKPRRRAAQ